MLEYRNKLDFADWKQYPRHWNKHNHCWDCCPKNHRSGGKGRKRKCKDPSHGYSTSDPHCQSLLKAPFTPKSCILDNLHGVLRTSDIMEDVLFEEVDKNGLADRLESLCKDMGM